MRIYKLHLKKNIFPNKYVKYLKYIIDDFFFLVSISRKKFITYPKKFIPSLIFDQTCNSKCTCLKNIDFKHSFPNW